MKKMNILLLSLCVALTCFAAPQKESNERATVRRIQALLGLPQRLQDGIAGDITEKAIIALKADRDALRHKVLALQNAAQPQAGVIEGPQPTP